MHLSITFLFQVREMIRSWVFMVTRLFTYLCMVCALPLSGKGRN